MSSSGLTRRSSSMLLQEAKYRGNPTLLVIAVVVVEKSGNPILLVIARFSSENRGNPEKKSLKKS